ncbi:hypothetical protein [Shinella sp. HZN7]|uniref:hypothetical protein n=1 Tax=Shinella sp. (strain HZN7) TaxID=879274 RepID=UPI00143ABB8D|nr:hypothetical protein [Shinella sp. HZN7]
MNTAMNMMPMMNAMMGGMGQPMMSPMMMNGMMPMMGGMPMMMPMPMMMGMMTCKMTDAGMTCEMKPMDGMDQAMFMECCKRMMAMNERRHADDDDVRRHDDVLLDGCLRRIEGKTLQGLPSGRPFHMCMTSRYRETR